MLNFLILSSLYSWIIFVVSFTCCVDASSPTYKLIDLGLQESDQSEALAVNDKGQIVGNYKMFGEKHYFIWDEKKGIVLIDLPESAAIVVLNNAGQIAGNYKDASGFDRGFLWNRYEGFNDIGSLGGNVTRIHDMNDLGQIVGESTCEKISLVDGGQEQQAFHWQNGFMIELGSLPGDLGLPGDRSKATGINNQGQIIGTSNRPLAHKGKLLRTTDKAVLWTNGIIECVDETLPPQYGAYSHKINNHGFALFKDNKSGFFVFDFSAKRKMEMKMSNQLSRAAYISDNGDLFFSIWRNDESNQRSPADIVFLMKNDAKHKAFNLEYYSDAALVDHEYVYFSDSLEYTQEWVPGSFEGANGFNNSRWAVGAARNIYGERHAVLLVPLEHELVIHEDEEELHQDAVKPKVLLGQFIMEWRTFGLTYSKFVEEVKEAIANGSDVNDKSRNGHHPLHLSIKMGYEEIALLLIKAGADIHNQDASGEDPIHIAINNGYFKVANALIAHGANFHLWIADLQYDYSQWYKFRYFYLNTSS